MKRIGILTAGGDTPALNATIHGAVARASQLRLEIFGFIKGFNSLLNPRLPHVHLNPLMREIPELDATMGGTVLGRRATICPVIIRSRWSRYTIGSDSYRLKG